MSNAMMISVIKVENNAFLLPRGKGSMEFSDWEEGLTIPSGGAKMPDRHITAQF